MLSRVCWGEGCARTESEVWISVLETDLRLRSAVDMFRSRGGMDKEILALVGGRSPPDPPPPDIAAEDRRTGERIPAPPAELQQSAGGRESHPVDLNSGSNVDSNGGGDENWRRSQHLDSNEQNLDSNQREVDSNLRDMTISPDVMDLDSGEEEEEEKKEGEKKVDTSQGTDPSCCSVYCLLVVRLMD